MESVRRACAHDLLRVNPDALRAVDGGRLPEETLAAAVGPGPSAWVVVRRARVSPGIVPVGVRGATRSERWAAQVPERSVRDVVAPWDITRHAPDDRASLGAFAALRRLDRALRGQGATTRWGPAGSAGFELATGRPAVTPSSDMDVVIDIPERWQRRQARELELIAAELDARVDIQLLTPAGGVALGEWAAALPRPVVARTADGPRLVDDPWAAP